MKMIIQVEVVMSGKRVVKTAIGVTTVAAAGAAGYAYLHPEVIPIEVAKVLKDYNLLSIDSSSKNTSTSLINSMKDNLGNFLVTYLILFLSSYRFWIEKSSEEWYIGGKVGLCSSPGLSSDGDYRFFGRQEKVGEYQTYLLKMFYCFISYVCSGEC